MYLSEYLIVLPPFHLKEIIYNFYLTDSSCQHHYPCTLGPLISTIRLPQHQHCNVTTVSLITIVTNNWINGRWHLQHGYTGQGLIHVYSGWSWRSWDFVMLLRVEWNVKLKNHVSGILYLIFLDHICLYSTETTENETVNKGEMTEHIHTYTHTLGIWSCDHGVWEVPEPDVSKLETWKPSVQPALLSWPIHMFFLPQLPIQTHPEIIHNQISGYPVTQSSWHMKLTATEMVESPAMGSHWRISVHLLRIV